MFTSVHTAVLSKLQNRGDIFAQTSVFNAVGHLFLYGFPECKVKLESVGNIDANDHNLTDGYKLLQFSRKK